MSGNDPNGSAVASQRIAEELTLAILSGGLAPGARLGQEEIAADYGASRVPVREALRMLETSGLVVVTPNRGARVRQLDLNELQLIYEVREVVEPIILGDAIPHMTEVDIAEAFELQRQIEVDRTLDDFLRLDRELHLSLYRRCTSPFLVRLAGQFWNMTQGYRRAFIDVLPPERHAVVDKEHHALLDAVRDRDVPVAQRVLRSHIRSTRTRLRKHPELFQ